MSKYVPYRSKKGPISFIFDKKVAFVVGILLLVSVLVMIISTGIGDMFIHPLHVIKALFGYGGDIEQLVVQQFRLPRIIVAFLVGASLAIAGAILQGIIRNPLASPDIIGITGGAGTAVLTFLTIFTDTRNNSLTVSINWMPLAAFIGATAIALLIYVLSWKNGVSPIRLVLIGIGLSAITQATTTVMMIFGPLYLATEANRWLTGTVYGVSWEDVMILLPWIIFLFPLAFIFTRHLNVQELGDEIATGVGSLVQRNRLLLLLIATALAGGAVSIAGGIGFIGLIAPHMARKLVGSSFGGLLPVAALLGGTIVVIADLVARIAVPTHDLPAGIFTAVIGAPYFIYLLYKSRNV